MAITSAGWAECNQSKRHEVHSDDVTTGARHDDTVTAYLDGDNSVAADDDAVDNDEISSQFVDKNIVSLRPS